MIPGEERLSTSAAVNAPWGAVVRNRSQTVAPRRTPIDGFLVEVAGWGATIRRTQGPPGVRCRCGQSKRVRLGASLWMGHLLIRRCGAARA